VVMPAGLTHLAEPGKGTLNGARNLPSVADTDTKVLSPDRGIQFKTSGHETIGGKDMRCAGW
jgi:hypothetical protein